ncbi:hypothetical protein [Pseudonocardia nigra]|uniref:hypothetical protein n=1 Tax=Pseudonocardia nigra TaxID=1921578 RepID=UPI001C5E3944|nr:hypothetical protein [Pseudonocardia nigra]
MKAAVRRLPGVQAFRRRFIYHYGELLTAMIRHPDTVRRMGRARSERFMRSQLTDPEVRARAWPDYAFGCKRVLFSSDYLPALQRPNVDLVTEKITGLTATGIETADGAHHEVDTIIWATGFATTRFIFPMDVVGAGGRSLAETWADEPRAHLGITVPGFPSLFVMYGSVPGHGLDALRLLVPRRVRPGRHELAGVHARVRGPHRAAAAGGVHADPTTTHPGIRLWARRALTGPRPAAGRGSPRGAGRTRRPSPTAASARRRRSP